MADAVVHETGLISVENGSPGISGYGTAFIPACEPGDTIFIDTGSATYSAVIDTVSQPFGQDAMAMLFPWRGPSLNRVPFKVVRGPFHGDPVKAGPKLAELLAVPKIISAESQANLDAAVVAKDAAEAAEGRIDTSEAAVLAAKQSVDASKQIVTTKRDEVVGLVDTAVQSAGTATTQAGIATDQASSTFAQAALAREWSEKGTDLPISTSPGHFSSLHWASKSQGYASAAQQAADVLQNPDYGFLTDVPTDERDYGSIIG